ncbi:MAG: hypothetical protein AAFY20_20450 [Cyanobacteria bacterium J06639_14]
MADLPAAYHVAVATSKLPGLLEHPAAAFAYYQSQGGDTVVS